MTSRRVIRSDEVGIWLGVLLDAAFDPTSATLNLARSAEIHNAKAREQGLALTPQTARDGKSQLLGLASDFTVYPDELTSARQGELLLAWIDRWMQPEDWTRLHARVRKRRQKRNAMTL